MKKTFSISKKRLSILAFIFSFIGYSQVPAIHPSFPKIAPGSPTVGSLMKFEEVPVNNYTGVPDISIPLFSVQTRSQDIALNISLNYHPASIAANEIASYVGLGWNLLAGGTIARNVRGLPDDTSPKPQDLQKKYGIHHSENPYYLVIDTMKDGVGNIDAPHINAAERYLWETVEKGKFDTEHDLYQYNFMGYSGRFYIEKRGGIFKIIKLDDSNAIKIDYNGYYFTLIDDKGYKYIFDITETTKTNTLNTIKSFGNAVGNEIYPGNQTELEYISAYHISRIEDNSSSAEANRLVTFKYFQNAYPESTFDDTETTNVIVSHSMDGLTAVLKDACEGQNVFSYFEPESIRVFQMRTTQTKKLECIEVPNKAKIWFTLEGQRRDRTFKSNFPAAEHRLHEVMIKDWNNNLIKKYELFHHYSEIKKDNVRMMLSSVVENNAQSYTLSYAQSVAPDPSSTKLGVDHWGFFNLKPSNRRGGIYRETASAMCIADVLTSMQLPTGGRIDYEFESNDYSYNGAIRLEDFSENPDRFIETYESVNLIENYKLQHIDQPFLKILDEQFVSFSASPDPNPNWQYSQWTINVCDLEYANPVATPGHSWPVIGSSDCPGIGCSFEMKLTPNWYYSYVQLLDSGAIGPILNYNLTARYLIRNPDTYYRKYLIGGGVRIKSISYTDGDILGKKSYNYDFHNEKGRSSGSLAYPKPVYKYPTSVRHKLKNPKPCKFLEAYFSEKIIGYSTTTTFDNLKAINTQGAYIGYKNVSVSQTGYIPGNSEVAAKEIKNGTTQYTYTSPIDHPITEYAIDYESTPNPTYVIPYPYRAPINRDFERGILKNEKYRDENGKLLSEVIYEHAIPEKTIITGMRPFTVENCPFGKDFIDYDHYMADFLSCNSVCYSCGDPSAYIFNSVDSDVVESFGWVKLKSKVTKNYFYDNDNTQSIVDIKEAFDYNETNKKISFSSKEIYNKNILLPELSEEQYTYLDNTTVRSQNDISKIQTIKSSVNGEQIASQSINYSSSLSPGNPDYLPQTIQTGKGINPLENKLRFNRYDIFGSPLEILRENGTPVVYIYDCNHRNLIAMVENATYLQVENALGSPMNSLGYSEADTTALNNLRNLLLQSNVTTYTYKPLVGISSVTDPRGRTATYYYDNFGRLIQVKDHDGNILSENVYKYRNQN